MTNRIPVLLTGPAAATRELVLELEPGLAKPIIHLTCRHDVLVVGLEDAATLILHDIDQLGVVAQRRLSAWLNVVTDQTLIISTSARPLFPMVRAHAFLDTLYYRLNTLYVDLGLAGDGRVNSR